MIAHNTSLIDEKSLGINQITSNTVYSQRSYFFLDVVSEEIICVYFYIKPKRSIHCKANFVSGFPNYLINISMGKDQNFLAHYNARNQECIMQQFGYNRYLRLRDLKVVQEVSCWIF